MARRGLNYYYHPRDSYGRLPKPSLETPRVFISHQKKDSDIARKIADYLEDAGIDIYFDQYDGSIDRSNPKSVVNAIRTGIENRIIYIKYHTSLCDSIQVDLLYGNTKNRSKTFWTDRRSLNNY